jgi:hypothetical protein
MLWPQHTTPPINAIVNNEEIVIPRKPMFIDAVQSTFGRGAARAVARGNQTLVDFVAAVAQGGGYGVVVLGDVEVEEVGVGEVPVAFCAAVEMGFLVVEFVV